MCNLIVCKLKLKWRSEVMEIRKNFSFFWENIDVCHFHYNLLGKRGMLYWSNVYQNWNCHLHNKTHLSLLQHTLHNMQNLSVFAWQSIYFNSIVTEFYRILYLCDIKGDKDLKSSFANKMDNYCIVSHIWITSADIFLTPFFGKGEPREREMLHCAKTNKIYFTKF